MRIIFMGTPDFARESLKAIFETNNEIVGVVTNPDKQKGRGMKVVYSPVKEFALEKGLKIFQPEKIKDNNEFIKEIKDLNPDLICVVAYGKILKKDFLDIPKLGCINVHGSILPQYRGAAPIQWAILNGEKTTGVTTMYMDEGMDTGDIILKRKVEIGSDETTGELWEKLSKIGGELLVETISKIEKGEAVRIKQGDVFSTAPMLKKEFAKIDWQTKTAQEIKNLVRGLNPIMGAYCFYNEKKIKIWKVSILNEKDFEKQFNKYIKDMLYGTIIIANSKSGMYVRAKEGIIKIEEIQGENARKMEINDFLRGFKIEENSLLK